MPANIREKLIGFGKARQADIATANTVANIWRLNKLNTTFANPRLNTENDAAELAPAIALYPARATFPRARCFRRDDFLASSSRLLSV